MMMAIVAFQKNGAVVSRPFKEEERNSYGRTCTCTLHQPLDADRSSVDMARIAIGAFAAISGAFDIQTAPVVEEVGIVMLTSGVTFAVDALKFSVIPLE